MFKLQENYFVKIHERYLKTFVMIGRDRNGITESHEAFGNLVTHYLTVPQQSFWATSNIVNLVGLISVYHGVFIYIQTY